MDRVLVLVEGVTEEVFVRTVLAPHLLDHGKVAIATIVVTKRVKRGPNFKGGVTSYNQVKRDLRLLLQDSNVRMVTTMLDLYGLPQDFPGCATAPERPVPARVAHIQSAFAAEVGDTRFVPYLSVHEFEALLFAEPVSAEWVYEDANVVLNLERVRSEFGGNPETINDRPETAPSKRVGAAFPRYEKALHGPLATAAAGIATLRAACPHFDAWVRALEG